MNQAGDETGALGPYEAPPQTNGAGPGVRGASAPAPGTGAELVRLAKQSLGCQKAQLEATREVADLLRQVLGALAAAPARSAPNSSGAGSAPRQSGKGGEVASARDLDSQWGNPTVKDPKRWTGPTYSGKRMSECPPEYLEELADFKDWQADKREDEGPDGIKKAGYCRKDAARARGWAERLRQGFQAPAAQPPGPRDDDVDPI